MGTYKNYGQPLTTINSIINRISYQYQDAINIVLLDEFRPCIESIRNFAISDEFHLTELNTSKPNVHCLIAINPVEYGGNTFKNDFIIIPPKDNNTLSCQLFAKHRTSYLVGIFVDHYKSFFQTKSNERSLDSSQDQLLDPDSLPSGRSPVWIQKNDAVSDIHVLEKIKKYNVLSQETVTIIFEKKDEYVHLWCLKTGWKYIHRLDIYGSEDEVIVIFDVSYLYPEQLSRARKCLIIVTTME